MTDAVTPLVALAWGLATFALVAAGDTMALRREHDVPRVPVRELCAALDRECPGVVVVDWLDRGE